MPDHIKLVCPNCKAHLRVSNHVGTQLINVVCPRCQTSAPFDKFLAPPSPVNIARPGCLVELLTGQEYELREGQNIIGRKASSSLATIQVPSPGNRMSRRHLVIEVSRNQAGSLEHTAWLFKPDVNATSINGVPIEHGMKLKLRNGDTIALPGLQLVLKI